MATTYSAWLAVRKGEPAEAVQLKSDLPVPTTIPKNHVLVKVLATALNPVGYKLLRSMPNFVMGRPHPMEQDFAGVVADANGTDFKVGDRVFGASPSPKNGTLAEYTIIPADVLATIPPNISAVDASGLATVMLTAVQALKDLKLEKGQTVFINGGSSAVGWSAIQLAKAKGYRVVATASGKNKELLLGLGVDEFIDYTESPLAERLKSTPPSPQFNGILDAVGLTDPALYLNCAKYLAPGGRYLTAGTLPHSGAEWAGLIRQVLEGLLRPSWLGGVPRKFGAVAVKFKKQDLDDIRQLVADGSVKPIVDSVYTFDRDGVMRAYERLMTKRAVGKVVVKVADEQ
ncbi:PKS-ER domain-containing protein [Mycena indigotica]|uniref:PKS-ER domain-containing protein n=1 Tax=Mycena indigotica TaxID=2126181 RepID=A0A8H6W6E8_9AGAR|nr:PKS-ER domain-containing protein [Mycena indigotica]KAF7307544.1 PKS-ER domain-containing protein [Mycena indigotica]